MSATRTRRTSSKKTAQKRGRSGASSSSRRSKGVRATPRKSARASKRGSPSRKTGAASKRSAASRSPIEQSIALLVQDHRKVDKMFRQAERVKDDMERLRPIVEEACAALTQHSQIEEQHFYPVMHQAAKETDLIAEAYVEHASLKELIAKLQRGRADEEQYAALFTVLGEYVKHHVKEEEGEIFPKARRLRADFQPLLDALMAREEGETRRRPSARGAALASEAQEPGRRSTRGRQGRGRSSSQDAQADGGIAAGREGMQSDVEQPRRGRRDSAREDTSETEEAGRGRDQESIEQEHRSRG